MHISEGILATPILIAGGAASVAGLGFGLKRLDQERIVPAAMLSALFFLASLVHVPLGPGNVHLVLNGLTGLMLGWVAFPVIFVALCLQAVLFQFGGLSTLGVNTLSMAGPAVLCAWLFRPLLRSSKPMQMAVGAFLTGFCALALSGLIMSAGLALSGEAFVPLAGVIMLAHLPLMLVEGIISVALVNFLYRVKPEVLDLAHSSVDSK